MMKGTRHAAAPPHWHGRKSVRQESLSQRWGAPRIKLQLPIAFNTHTHIHRVPVLCQPVVFECSSFASSATEANKTSKLQTELGTYHLQCLECSAEVDP